MAWPLTWVRITGTLPGIFVGYYVSENTPSAGPQSFQAFCRLCLTVPGVRIHYDPMTDFAQARQGSRTVEDKSETLMTILHTQPYSGAGATLPGTFLAPIAGVVFHRLNPARAGFSKAPDWLLGIPFGARGFLGTCWGARLQRCLPQRMFEALLALIMVSSAGCYVWEFFSQA